MAENGLPGNAPDLTQSFGESAGSSDPAPEAGPTVTSTARAEIDIALETHDALVQHEDRWRQLSDRLSNHPLAEPTLDMDSAPVRSIAREYTEHRRQWETQRDTIETKAVAATASVRAQGTTLTREFGSVSENSNPGHDAAPEPTRAEAKEADRFQREFAVRSMDMGQSRDR